MKILYSLITAFQTYSRIPMPEVAWKPENRRYALCFFPLVGAVIGAIFLLWKWISACLAAMLFRNARGDGMLHESTQAAQKNMTVAVLALTAGAAYGEFC